MTSRALRGARVSWKNREFFRGNFAAWDELGREYGGDPRLVGAAPSREPRRKREFLVFLRREKGIYMFFPLENGNFWDFFVREKGIAAFREAEFGVRPSAGKRKFFLFQRKKRDFSFS